MVCAQPRSARRRNRGEAGFSIFEVVIAVTILGLMVAGMATSTNTGLELVGTSKARQTATQLANRWMEEARSTPYSALGLPTGTLFEAGADSPDAAVGGSGTTYTSAAGTEPLVMVAAISGVPHHEEDVLNGVEYGLYRYVTWVTVGSDSQAYKRVTVVVQWPGRDTAGRPNRLTTGTLVGPHGVSWGPTTTTTAAPASSTTTTSPPATTSTTAAPGECPDSTTDPSTTMAILAGTGSNVGYTSSSTVTLSLSTVSPCRAQQMQFSNDNSTWSTYEAFATSKLWQLPSGNGDRTVYGRFKASNGRTTTRNATVRVDGTPPSQPGSFSLTELSSPKRAKLTWTTSTDNDTLVGYYVFRKIDNAASFTNLTPGVTAPCSTSPCQFIDNGVQNKKSYSYYVVAYDAAGNFSAQTPTLQITI
jgi:hypothetical protein